MKGFQRVVSFLLAIVLVAGMVPPVAVRAEETQPTVETVVEETVVPTAEAVAETEEPAPVTTEAAEETTAPTESTTVPTEAVTEPAETVTTPTEGETLPTESETEPSADATVPEAETTVPEEPETELADGEGAEMIVSGTCGDNLTWVLDDSGTLTISGTGKMADFASDRLTSTSGYYGYAPWYDYKDTIITVVVQEGVTSISEHAFRWQQNTRKVTIPESVTLMEHRVYGVGGSVSGYSGPFLGCTSLTSAGPIGSGCDLEFGWTEQIPSGAFYCMENLSKVIIPGTITAVGGSAFEQAGTSLTTAGPIGSGCDYEFGWTESIAEGAFAGLKSLHTVTLPAGLQNIGSSAFYECSALKNITFPVGLTTIGGAAFCYCKTLEEVILPANLTTLGDSAFEGCSSLKEVILPANLTTLGAFAFYGCSSLKAVTISGLEGLIEEYTFAGCTSLETLTLGEGVTGMEEFALSGCSRLKKLTVPESLTSIPQKLLKDCANNFTSAGPVGSGCDYEFGWTTVIPGNAFSNMSNLKKITIPETVADIGYGAFTGCTGITSMGPVGSGCDLESDWTIVPSIGLPNISKIIIPETVTSVERLPGENIYSIGPIGSDCDYEYGWIEGIPEYAFDGMRKAKEFFWPQVTENGGITNIGRYAFTNCTALKQIVIPETVSSIGISAFSGCTGLTEAAIQGPITAVPQWMFRGCTALENVIIPASVQTIQSQAFYNCNALKNIYYEGTEEMWNEILVQYGNEALYGENVVVHFGYNAIYLQDIRYYSSYAGRIYLVDEDGEKEYRTSAGVTDSEFLADKGALLGTYVIPVFVETEAGIILKNLLPVESRSGTVTEANRSVITVNGESFKTPIDLKEPEQYDGKFVIYQVYEGNLAGISVLEIANHLDNTAIPLNGQGGAYAYYRSNPYLILTYRVDQGEEKKVWANAQGVFRVPLGTFKTPGLHDVWVEITRVGNVALSPTLELHPTVEVIPLSFTQKSVLTFAPEASVGVGAGAGINLMDYEAKASLLGLEAGIEAVGAVTINREYAGSDTQSFEITSTQGLGINSELSTGVYFGKKVDNANKEDKDSFTIAGLSAGVKGSEMFTYGLRFNEFNGSFEQNMAIATFIWGEYLRINPTEIMMYPLYQEAAKELYPKSGAVYVTGESAAVTGSIGSGMGALKINGEEIFSLVDSSLNGTLSSDAKYGSDGSSEKSISLQTDRNVSVGNFSVGDKTEVNVGALSQRFLGKDITISAKNEAGVRSLTATSLDSGKPPMSFLLMGEYVHLDYDKYTLANASLDAFLGESNEFNRYVNGQRMILTDEDFQEIANEISGADSPVTYARETKQRALFSVPLTFGGGFGLFANVGTTISYENEVSYDSASGYAVNDALLLTGETDGVSQRIENEIMEIPEYIQAALTDLWEGLKWLFKTVTGAVVDGVKAMGAWIAGDEDNEEDWTVAISYVDLDAQTASASYRIRTFSAAEDSETSAGIYTMQTGNAMEEGATVSRPYVISVTDNATGKDVADFSNEPLKLTICYTPENLESAGLSASSSIVRNGGIAMYRYSDHGKYFEYVGGTNDLEAMTVTAQITRPGQYVLAVDACAPALSYLDISNSREMPTITAYIDDLTGLNADSFRFCIDGIEKVNGSSLAEHYNTAAGIFTYAVSEAEKLSEGEHTLSFTLADTSGNAQTYAYSFQVDLTAPEISGVTVSGATNEGSLVEIRAQVSDPNLTAVYAVLSRQLPDGSWSQEVATAMGDMGDSLWGLDYEGDGSSVRVFVKAVDIGENETKSDTFEARPFVEGITLSQEYIALQAGQSQQLTAEVQPVELVNSLQWSVEEGGEYIISVEGDGSVTGLAEGTAYVIATATDGEKELSARCRVDVAEPIRIDGIQLNTTKLTTELFSTDYAEFDLLLELPQNASLMSVDRKNVPEDKGVAIDSVRFTASTTAVAFDLVALDDRHIAVVPTEYALEYPEELAKTYKSAVIVWIDGEDYTTEEILTLTVKQSKPKLKAKIDTFNSFYTGQTQEIAITGGTAEKITIQSHSDWLDPNSDGTLSLNEHAEKKNSGKVVLLVETKEWNIPAEVTLTVKNAWKAPGLKLNMSSVKIAEEAAKAGIDLQLQPRSKKDTLSSLKVAGIQAPEGYEVKNFNSETGTFTLKAANGFQSDKITLNVQINGTNETVPLTLKVQIVKKDVIVSFKISGNLDLSLPNNVVTVKPTFKNYNGGFTFTAAETDQFTLKQEGNTISVRCRETAEPGTYAVPLKLNLDGGNTIDSTVKLTVKRTAVKLKLSGSKMSLNKSISDMASVTVTCTTKGYDLKEPIVQVMDKSGKNPSNGVTAKYADGKLTVSVNENTEPGAAYKVQVRAYEGAPAATLTVTILKENKSTISASLKAKGSIDVIRAGTAITLTPSYKNAGNLTEKEEKLVFFKTVKKETTPADDLFAYTRNTDGTYTITKAADAVLDHSAKYTVKLVSTIGSTEVESKPVSLTVNQGKAKLTLAADSNILFSRDSRSRVNFTLTAKDAQLNGIETVASKDDRFVVHTYGNGEFALGFANDTVDKKLQGKTVTITLNIFLEGNETDKPNTTAKLKVKILK